MGVNVSLREERIFAWHRIPKSSRTVLISTLIIIVFLTPNLAEGYESTWYKIDLDSEEHYNDALIDSNGDAWIFGDNGIIVFGEELTNWSLIETVTSEDLLTAYSNENLVVAAGTNGTVIYKTTQSEQWLDVSINSEENINSISLNSNDEIVIVTEESSIKIYKESSWLEINSFTSDDLFDITFENERGLISGSSGLILGSEDNGYTWEQRETPVLVSQSDIISIGFYKSNRAYAITSDGMILKSTQEALTTTVGYSWNIKEIESENYSTTLDVNLTSIEILSTTKIILTGKNGYVALSKDGGNIVTPQLLPDGYSDQNINDVAMETAFRGIIVGDNGMIFYTENGGKITQLVLK